MPMVTQPEPFPVQEFPVHLLQLPEDPIPDATIGHTATISPALLPPAQRLGALRAAAYCLPVALVMWAIIIAAIVHFLIA